MKTTNTQIDLSTIKNIINFELVYHTGKDTLFIRSEKPQPATSVDWEGEIWVRVNPENGEIVGLEIEDFEAIFLKKHPELEMAWEEVKPLCYPKPAKKKAEPCRESFIRILLNFLVEFFRYHPQQASFAFSS